MMFHICFTNPKAWEISYQKGVYGNVEGENDQEQTLWGKVADLLAIKKGDYVFFYIKKSMVLAGLFEVTSEPYYCEDYLFEDETQCYPFRFNFKEVSAYKKYIPVSELAKLIQMGNLFSISTFERDANATFRGIRQITSLEADNLKKILLRYNPKVNTDDVKTYEEISVSDTLLEARELISRKEEGETFETPTALKLTLIPTKLKRVRDNYYISKYENALQGYIYYCIKRNLKNIISDLDLNNSIQWLLEAPILHTQQFRSDILCLYNEINEAPHFYSIIEIKRDQKITISDLSQLIGYMKAYADLKKIPFSSIEGIYISNKFEEGVTNYLKSRKDTENENPIRLIEYSTNEEGVVTFEELFVEV
ncbi:MAG: EVE domain-containing protein [Flavipsychrobacter sp.]